jgi:beta-lactamase regulating signal transducer with metallopeptidase domain
VPTLEVLSSLALESILCGVVLGVALVIAIAAALKLLDPLNAATRAIIWTAALCTLPFLALLYFAGHIPLPAPPPATIAQNTFVIAPVSPVVSKNLPSPPQVTSTPLAVRRHLTITVPSNFAQGLLALYFVIVPLLLLRLLISYVRLRLLRRRTHLAPSELAARLQQWLTRCPTLRRVELRLSPRARSPLAIGFRRPIIVMPADLVLELSREEYDDLGVHELAHIARYDDWTNLLQHILQAFLFFHPAAHYIARQLNLERELACDDWVVSEHESKSYARCLTKVLELRRYHRRYQGGALLLSSGAFFGKRQIFKRVESLLDKTRNAATGISAIAVTLVVVAMAAAAIQVMHLPEVVAFAQEQSATSSMRWSDDSRDLRIKLRGDLTFSPDEQSIAAISPGGFIIIDESKGWSHRRLEVHSGPGAAPETKYLIDGREKPLDGVGRAWAASSYLFVLREIGLDAEARIDRILARRGPAGVLEEIDLIHSDQVKRRYLTQLLKQATLSSADLQRVNDSARKISSDNDKAGFLLDHQHDLAAASLRTSYFRAVNSISSDNDRRRVLVHLLETDGQDPEIGRLVALSAKEMSSDNDKADILLAIPATGSAQTGCALLTAAKHIQSDNDKARVLRDSAYAGATQCRDAYFAAVNLIQSDNDRAGVLQNLMEHATLTPETYRDIAHSAKAINSDNDKANVLILVATQYTAAPFFDAANTIQSSNDRARVLKAVLDHHPTIPALLDVIHSAASLPDDHEKAEILLAIAPQSNQPELRAALQQACEKLSSDNDYRRVASALFKESSLK